MAGFAATVLNLGFEKIIFFFYICTNEHNNGYCESDGTNYFCADRNWFQRKDCVKHESAKDDTDNSTAIN